MANLKILRNIVHQGTILKKGMIVSDETQDLSSVARSLIDRGLVEVTEDAATHTAALVNGAQEALPLTSAASGEGQKPKGEIDAQRKAEAQAKQQPINPLQASQVEQQANKESQTVNAGKIVATGRQPGDPASLQPSPEQIKQTLASV